MQSNKIVVCGATGNQGGAVAAALLRSGRWSVAALTRDPDTEKARALAASGAEVVQADLSDMASLRDAFDGAFGVFAVTQPWSYERRVFDTGAEMRQGKNIVWACLEAGVPHVVYSSLINLTGSPSGVPWIDSKLVLEELFRKYLPVTMIIRPALYMEHIGSQLLKVSGKVIRGRFGADARVPYIALQDIGISAARLFDAPDTYKGTKQVLAGDLVTGNEVAAMLSGLAGDRHFSYRAQFGPGLRIFQPRFFAMRRFFEAQGISLFEEDVPHAGYPTLPVEPLPIKEFLEKAACRLLGPA